MVQVHAFRSTYLYQKKKKKGEKKTIRKNSALPAVFEVLCHNVQICYFLVSGIEEVTLIGDISNEDI